MKKYWQLNYRIQKQKRRWGQGVGEYRQTSNIRGNNSQHLNASCLSNEIRCYVGDEDVVGAAPKGYAPTTGDQQFICLLRCDLYYRFYGNWWDKGDAR